eukprot:2462070-Amphidinium_carterae.1
MDQISVFAHKQLEVDNSLEALPSTTCVSGWQVAVESCGACHPDRQSDGCGLVHRGVVPEETCASPSQIDSICLAAPIPIRTGCVWHGGGLRNGPGVLTIDIGKEEIGVGDIKVYKWPLKVGLRQLALHLTRISNPRPRRTI